jgi:transcription elongation factor Elf1
MTNGYLIRMNLRTSTEEKDETVTSLRANCKNCGSKIEIQLHTVDDRGVRFESIVGTLRVLCDQCGQAHNMNIRAKFTPTGLLNLTNLRH